MLQVKLQISDTIWGCQIGGCFWAWWRRATADRVRKLSIRRDIHGHVVLGDTLAPQITKKVDLLAMSNEPRLLPNLIPMKLGEDDLRQAFFRIVLLESPNPDFGL